MESQNNNLSTEIEGLEDRQEKNEALDRERVCHMLPSLNTLRKSVQL